MIRCDYMQFRQISIWHLIGDNCKVPIYCNSFCTIWLSEKYTYHISFNLASELSIWEPGHLPLYSSLYCWTFSTAFIIVWDVLFSFSPIKPLLFYFSLFFFTFSPTPATVTVAGLLFDHFSDHLTTPPESPSPNRSDHPIPAWTTAERDPTCQHYPLRVASRADHHSIISIASKSTAQPRALPPPQLNRNQLLLRIYSHNLHSRIRREDPDAINSTWASARPTNSNSNFFQNPKSLSNNTSLHHKSQRRMMANHKILNMTLRGFIKCPRTFQAKILNSLNSIKHARKRLEPSSQALRCVRTPNTNSSLIHNR